MRRGEDEHLWARHYYARILNHSCSRIWLPTATCILMFCSQAYLALVAWTPPPPYELPSEKQYRTPKAPKTLRPLPSIDDAASLDLSVIVPAYNETERLPSMLSSTLEHLASFPKRTFEIVVVDDHSSDGTAAFVLKHAAERYPKADIRVVQMERNLGKGGAVRHGMLHARGRRLLMVDADGASRFADVELLLGALDSLAPMETEDALGVAIGSRAHLVNTEAVVKVRFFFSKIFLNFCVALADDATRSGLSCATSLCTACTPSCASRASGTSATRSAGSSYFRARRRARCSRGSASRRGYLTSSCCCLPRRWAFPSQRCR